MSQHPIRWTHSIPTIANVLADGTILSSSMISSPSTAWQLSFEGLNEEERAGFQTFFESLRGALNSFTMLDPADNLLAYSEDFTQACWATSGLVTITPGAADPFGGSGATTATNAAQTSQTVEQQLPAPALYCYCFSIYLRADMPQSVSLCIQADSGALKTQVVPSDRWNRFTLTSPGATGGSVSFGVEIAPGARIQIFGAQAEAQPAAGPYKRTTNTTGVYEDCRLDSDDLEVTCTSAGTYRCQLRVRSARPLPW